jgi:hypothetical protein
LFLLDGFPRQNAAARNCQPVWTLFSIKAWRSKEDVVMSEAMYPKNLFHPAIMLLFGHDSRFPRPPPFLTQNGIIGGRSGFSRETARHRG